MPAEEKTTVDKADGAEPQPPQPDSAERDSEADLADSGGASTTRLVEQQLIASTLRGQAQATSPSAVAAAAAAARPGESAGSREIDLADSASRLAQLIQDEAEEAEASTPREPAEAEEAPRPDEVGLSGFQRWLARTRQLGRRASQLLAVVEALNGQAERRERLAELVRLNLLLECNHAIGFNADGTLRNTDDPSPILTEAEMAAMAAKQKEADLKELMKEKAAAGVTSELRLEADDEVLMAKEELLGRPSGNGLLVLTLALLCGSTFASLLQHPEVQELIWFIHWLILVSATACWQMLIVAIFVRSGQRRRPLEAYREMGRELQNNRILISTIRRG